MSVNNKVAELREEIEKITNDILDLALEEDGIESALASVRERKAEAMRVRLALIGAKTALEVEQFI